MKPLSIPMVPLLAGALLFSVNPSRAQMVIQPDHAPPALPDRKHPALPQFSMEQRATIYRSVIVLTNEHRAVPLPIDTQVEVGRNLPETAELYPVPEAVLTQTGASNKYKYAVWNGQVLLIDPAKKTVVDILHGDVLRDYDKPK